MSRGEYIARTRFLVADLIFALYFRWRELVSPNREELGNLAIISFALLVTANGLVVWAEQ